MTQLSVFSGFSAEISEITSKLPKPEDISQALYILDIGQNDLHYGLVTMTRKQVTESIPYIISQFALSIEVVFVSLLHLTFHNKLAPRTKLARCRYGCKNEKKFHPPSPFVFPRRILVVFNQKL